MNFELSDLQKELVERTRLFFEPRAAECHLWYEKPQPETFWKVSRELAEAGFMGLCLDTEAGGLGLGMFEACLMIEEASRHDPNAAYIARNATAGPTAFIAFLGTAEQRERYVRPVMRGEGATAICITEPQAGSDAGAMRTRATRVAGGYRLNGGKHYITNGKLATSYVVYCQFDAEDGAEKGGIGALILHPGMDGFTVGKGLATMDGGRIYELYFDDVFVPDAQLLIPGRPDKGSFKRLMSVYNLERLSGQFRWLGVAQRAFDMARDYLVTREQFGRPLIEFQALQMKLADMKVKLEAARLLLYRAALPPDGGLPRRADVSMGKVVMQEALKFILDESIQIHGGAGYCRELPLEYFYRMARMASIAGGSLEVHRGIVASAAVGRKLGNAA